MKPRHILAVCAAIFAIVPTALLPVPSITIAVLLLAIALLLT